MYQRFKLINTLLYGKHYIECDCSITDAFYPKSRAIGRDLNKLGAKGNRCKDGVTVHHTRYRVSFRYISDGEDRQIYA